MHVHNYYYSCSDLADHYHCGGGDKMMMFWSVYFNYSEYYIYYSFQQSIVKTQCHRMTSWISTRKGLVSD